MSGPKRHPAFNKLAERVIEEIAISSIVSEIAPEGSGVQIPESWMKAAMQLRGHLIEQVEEESHEEEMGKVERKVKSS